MYEIRDFMPGECTLGSEVAIFEAVDQAEVVTPDIQQKIEIAKIACLGCDQLSNCREQIEGIEEVLSARANGARFVIGGEVADRVEPKEPDSALNEPNFEFDLARVPDDPRQQLAVIRQGFRKQLKPKGRELVHHPLLRDRLGASLIAERSDWTDDEVRAAADAMAAWFLKYRTARLSYRQRKHELAESELAAFDAISAIFVADVEDIKASGLEKPAFIARFHEPAFVKSFMQKYESSFNTTPGQVRKIVSHFSDPITKIEEVIAENQLSKQAANVSGRNASEAALSSIDALSTAKYKERYQALVREHGLERYYHVPEARRYFEKIARNSADPDTAVRAFTKRVRQLRRDHPNIEDTVLAYIACVADDAEQSIQDFERNFDAICQKYEKHTYFSRGRFQRMAFIHSKIEKVEAAADAYIDRAARIKAACEKANIEIDDVFIRDTASYVELDINEDSIIYQHKRYNLRRNLTDAEYLLETWMRDKIARLYDHETYMVAAQHLSIFLNRGYLQVAFMTEDKPTATFDYVDQKGRYLAWGDDAACLAPEEKEAILSVFKLDRLVLGEDIDEATLKRHFKTEDIAGYVDEYILPYTLPKSVDLQDGKSMLEWLRYWGRSNKNKITGSAARPNQKRYEAALKSTLQKLEEEHLDGHDIASGPCKEGLRLLLLRVGLWSLPALKDEEACLKIVHSYLEDVSKTKNCGLSDAYTIALGYSAEFCEQFQTIAENIVTGRQVVDLLNKTTMQAMLQLRLYQKRFLEYEPQFAERRIAKSYRRSIAFLYKHDSGLIDDLLQAYDEVSIKYASNKKVTPGVINHFVVRLKKKPLAEIQDWLEAIEGLDERYFTRLDENNIKRVAYTKRGPELNIALDGYIQSVEDLLQNTPPHPGVDRIVAEYVVFRTPDSKKGLEAYMARWHFVHARIDTSDIPLPILRRLILFSSRSPLWGIEGYRKIVKYYEGDSYIQRYMIDEAIKWSITEAMNSLVKMRKFLARESVRMDKSHNEQNERSNHERVSVGVLTPEQIVLGEDDQDDNRQALAAIMQTMPEIEKAVIAVVHDIPWLAPADLRDEEGVNIGFLFAHYGIKRFEALVSIADNIIKKLHSSR